MSGVTLTVHRATNEIGGNCIEIVAPCGDRVILDVGRPLDAPNEATGLIPATLDRSRPAHILISHPHQDHYGLLGETPTEWPVHCGEASEKLMRLTAGITGKVIDREFTTWKSGEAKSIGAFSVTPYLTDHSAFDAHMLLVEVAGKRMLYSGDFRLHGRKGALVERMMASPPPDIDVLLMEGTNIGSDKPTMSEGDLEADFATLFNETPGRVFVTWSAQNIDRTVTLYRACLKARRTLVVDLYTAEVLDILAEHGKLPQPDWDGVKVVVSTTYARLYRRKGREDFVERMVKNGIPAHKLADTPGRWVVMTRPPLMRDFARARVTPTPDDAWSWSMWSGYLRNEDGQRVQAWFDEGGARACHIHTSGHASSSDLKAFAMAMKPKAMVPIHGENWDGPVEGFPPIRRIHDGEPLIV